MTIYETAEEILHKTGCRYAQKTQFGWLAREKSTYATHRLLWTSSTGLVVTPSSRSKRVYYSDAAGVKVIPLQFDMKLPTAQQLADEFCRQLQGTLDSADFATLQARNRNEDNANLCHSHDFCDSNVVMWNAIKSLTGFEPDESNPQMNGKYMPGMTDELGRLWSTAWNKAREQDFIPSRTK